MLTNLIVGGVLVAFYAALLLVVWLTGRPSKTGRKHEHQPADLSFVVFGDDYDPADSWPQIAGWQAPQTPYLPRHASTAARAA